MVWGIEMSKFNDRVWIFARVMIVLNKLNVYDSGYNFSFADLEDYLRRRDNA